MDINQLTDPKFASFKDLQEFSAAQTGLINTLNKKINQLEQENQHLKELLDKNVPVLFEENGTLELLKSVSDEMAVCIMQIRLLKDKCKGGLVELTAEEARKLDIYTKLLISLKAAGEKDKPKPEEKLSDEEFNKQLKALIGE